MTKFDGTPCGEVLHARCGAGEKLEIISNAYLWLSGAKSQGMKQLMAK
ncbi:MAG: hypothetical protein ACLVH0_04545 [Coprococcus eutactus]